MSEASKSRGSPCRPLRAACRSFVEVRVAAAPEIRGWCHAPYRRGLRQLPHARSLRIELVPGARLEEAKLLVLHQVELGIELNDVVVGVAMKDKQVVTDCMPSRPPDDRPLVLAQGIAGDLEVSPIPQLERHMMHEGGLPGDEIHGVMVRTA